MVVFCAAAACFAATAGYLQLEAADPAKPPAPSSFAPAARLVQEAERLTAACESATADEAAYKDLAGQVTRDASTLAALALALGLHDEENAWKKSAASIMEVSLALADAGDFAQAKACTAKLKEAVAGKVEAENPELAWQNPADMVGLMKQCANLFSRVKRSLAPSRFARRKDDLAQAAAALAAIGHVTMFDENYVSEDAEIALWKKHCLDWRTAAGELVQAIEKADQKGAEQAMTRLDRSCTECHQALKVEVKE